MHISHILARLEKPKQTGKDSWIACCPSHRDKRPSMTIKALDDGRILLHCFAGCEPLSVLQAINLTFDDLFPERIADNLRPVKRPFNAHDILECIYTEAAIIALASIDLRNKKPMSEEDHQRLIVAAGRIAAARDLANG